MARRPFVSNRLHRLHGLDQPVLLRRRKPLEQGGDLVVRSLVQRREGLRPAGVSAIDELPRIGLGRGALDQAALLELLQQPAEIAGVEAEIAREVGGGQAVAMRQFVEHARLGQREGAFQQPFVEQPDLAGVEAVEGPHGIDPLIAGLMVDRHGALLCAHDQPFT